MDGENRTESTALGALTLLLMACSTANAPVPTVPHVSPQPQGIETVSAPQGSARLFAHEDGACRIAEPGEVVCWGQVPQRVQTTARLHRAVALAFGSPTPGPSFCALDASSTAVCESHCVLGAPDRQCRLESVEGIADMWPIGYTIVLRKHDGGACIVRASGVACVDVRQAGDWIDRDAEGYLWKQTALEKPIGTWRGDLLLRDGRVCRPSSDDKGQFVACYPGPQALEPLGQLLAASGLHVVDKQGTVLRYEQPSRSAESFPVELGGTGLLPQVGTFTPVRGIRYVSRLATSVSTTCAFRERGAAFCYDDQKAPAPAVTAPLAGGSCVVDVAAGNHFVCVHGCDGQTRCRGSNHLGQLGFPPPAAEASHDVELPRVDQVAVGHENTCAVTQGGQVFCWGSPHQDLLGELERTVRATPVAIPLPGPARSVSVGFAASCALLRDGRVVCWFKDHPNSLAPASDQDPFGPTVVAGLPPADQIATAGVFACARSNSTLWCWGDNRRGQLGAGHQSFVAQPTKVPSLDDVIEFALSWGAGCAVHASGAVSCWGEVSGIERGQLTRATHVTNATRVAFNHDGFCVVRRDGSVGCLERIDDVPQVQRVTNARTVVGTESLDGTCVVTNAGTIDCWGEIPGKMLSSLAELSDVRDLALGSRHACAIHANGLRCAGSNHSGQLGTGEVLASSVLLQVPAEPYVSVRR